MRIQERKGICFMVLLAMCFLAGCGGTGTPGAVEVVENTLSADLLEAMQKKEEETKPEPVESQEDEVVTFTISCAGDCSLGNHKDQDYSYSFRQMYDSKKDPGYFLGNVRDIFAADDLTIVNLEGALTLSEQYRPNRTYNIKGDPEYVQILTEGSVEAVSMGNNHRADYGAEGVRDTIEALESIHIAYAYDDNIGYFEKEGIRVGFLSVNEASDGKRVEAFITDGMDTLKEEGVDLILVCCHWGTEKDNYPETYQQELGRKCIDLGADLVIGHHPHVLQGIEEYQGKYILYSLGNFCFGANRNPSDKDTMIFQQTFTFVNGEKQEETEIKIIPCRVSSVNERNDYCPTPVTGQEAERILERVRAFSEPFGTAFSNGLLLFESFVSKIREE